MRPVYTFLMVHAVPFGTTRYTCLASRCALGRLSPGPFPGPHPKVPARPHVPARAWCSTSDRAPRGHPRQPGAGHRLSETDPACPESRTTRGLASRLALRRLCRLASARPSALSPQPTGLVHAALSPTSPRGCSALFPGPHHPAAPPVLSLTFRRSFRPSFRHSFGRSFRKSFRRSFRRSFRTSFRRATTRIATSTTCSATTTRPTCSTPSIRFVISRGCRRSTIAFVISKVFRIRDGLPAAD